MVEEPSQEQVPFHVSERETKVCFHIWEISSSYRFGDQCMYEGGLWDMPGSSLWSVC